MQSLGDESAGNGVERSATLPKPGTDQSPNLTLRSSFDSRRSTADGDTGRDHASRIIQKLDLHRKSTIVPQVTGIAAASSSSSAGIGGIASLISASHNVMPLVPPPAPEAPLLRPATVSTIRDLPASSLAPNTLANPPAPTNLSSMAIICNGEKGISMGRTDATGGMPGGLMANIWGTTNWGYLNRLERGELKSLHDSRLKTSAPPSPQPTPSGSPPTRMSTEKTEPTNPFTTQVPSTPGTSPRHRKTISLGSEDKSTPKAEGAEQEYPNYYPLQLKTQDAQFHLLFPNVREKVVLVFRATWNLNDNDYQGFPGRVYVTAREIFFYSHHLGLILISGVSLASIIEVTAAPGRDCDFLFLHLADNSNQTGFTRIAIKIFLEPLRLLHKRVNFLVRNCTADEPLELEAIMKSLIKLEQEDPAESPSLQSWEDVSKSSFYEGPNGGQRPTNSQRMQQDLRAAVLVDQGFDRPSSKVDDLGKDTTKFKLPRQPVIYGPAGMGPAVIEKEFEISPKALFHVLFGDKSAVWQLLYHERQALYIKQGSWVQPDQGHLRRKFDYQIVYHNFFGQTREAAIVDWQVIDVLNDHLCYVVTDRKTPWYLPSNQSFLLHNKIVITHVAKSRCKLAIYAKVDWLSKPGIIGGVVTKRALHDLELDAQDLSDVVTEQVRRLGPRSRTKKAVQIFGQVGQQTQASEFAGSDSPSNISTRRSMKRRTMFGLFLETAASLATGVITTMITWALALLKWVGKTCNANSILIAVLAASVCTNLFFSSWSTRDWWRERSAGKFMARLGVVPDPVMSRALHIGDIYDANDYLEDAFSEQSINQCRQTFQDLTSLVSPSAPLYSKSRTARHLQRTRQRLGSYRHDLLVAMRVVNSIEQEVVQAEYESWLMGENSMCEQLRTAIRANRTELQGERLLEVTNWQGEYCESCGREEKRVFGKQERVMEV